MAASVTSFNFSLNPTNPFRHYHGPPKPKPKRAPKPDQVPSRKVRFTNIDEILGPAESDPAPKIGEDWLEAGSQGAPIAIEDSESETDSEDELPTVEELVGRRPALNQEEAAGAVPAAEGLIGDTSTPAAVGHDDGGSGGNTDGDARRFSQPSEGEMGAEERGEAAVNSGSAEHGGGRVGDDDGDDDGNNNGAMGTDLQFPQQRKRTRSLSSDATVTALGAPEPDPDEPLEGPHAAKRQRSCLRTGEGDESMPMHAPTPTLIPPQASQAATAEARSSMDNEGRGAEYKGEAVVATAGGSDASGDEKTADREDGDYAGGDDNGDDTGDVHDEPLKRVRPATRPTSTSRIGDRRAIGNDDNHRTQSPVRPAGRRRRARPSRKTGLPAAPFARRPAARLVNQRMAGIKVHSPLAEVALPPLHRPAFSAVRKGAVQASLDSNNDGRSSQGHQHKVTEIFLAVTVQTAGDILQLSSSEPANLVESALGYAGKAEDVAIKPLGPEGSWQVSGKFHLLHPRNIGSDVPTSTTGLQKRARSLCSSVGSGTGNDAEVANTTDGEDEDGISDDGHRRLHDAGYSGDGSSGDDDDDDGCGDHGSKASATGRRNRRWERSEERRLLAWRREGKPLAWIAGRLNRTEGAVYLRLHTLQRAAQGAD